MTFKRKNKSDKASYKYARVKIEQIKAASSFRGDASKLASLAQSMKTCGMLQPLIVRESGRCYELIAGERRYRAALIADFRYVDVMVVKTDEQGCLIISLAERLSEGMDLFEEARVLRDAAAAGLTYRKISNATGISVERIGEKIRLLQLDTVLRGKIIKAGLTEEQALDLLQLPENQRHSRVDKYLPTAQTLKISGFVRDGAILARPLLDAVSHMEKAGIKCDVEETEDPEHIRFDITLHKKL